jgi:ABC-2 type transport system ATP-binding protein
MHDTTITVSGLRKRFGPNIALDGMSFAVRPGVVTGFVGPNGAGKSTTMRVILGLDAADEGTALVGGRPYRGLARPLCHLGSLLDAAALQPGRTARNHLLWLAHSQGLPSRRADEVLELAGLGGVGKRRAGGYSLGMRQRLGIAAALLGDPPALMLDEPFNGMDPEGIIWMRTFLRELSREGRAVLVSSHLMSELQGTADHVVVAGRGRVIADAGVAELLAGAANGRIVVRSSALERASAVLREHAETVTANGDGTITVTGPAAEDVIARLSAAGVPFSEVSAHRATLEDAYLELTRDAVEFRATESSSARFANGDVR